MAGLHGGFAGKSLSNFDKGVSLKLRPPIDDPLFAIRRYLCLQPQPSVAPLPGPPPMVGDFIPLITSEDLIISEPWEDAPLLNTYIYLGSGDASFAGDAAISETNSYTGSGSIILGGTAFVSQSNDYIGNGGANFDGAAITEGPSVVTTCCEWFFSDEFLST